MHSKRIQEKVKEDYNQIAAEFSETRHFPWEEFDDFLTYYQANSKVLDLGCGNGRLLHFLAKHGYAYYLGVDQSEGLLEHAKKAHPKEDFLLADISKLSKLQDEFDALFAVASFHHLPRKEQLSTLLKWRSLLKPGGMLFMTNWNLFRSRFWRAWLKQLWPRYGLFMLEIPWAQRVNRVYFAFTIFRLNRLLKRAGFKVLLQKKGKNIVTIAQK